MTARLSSLEELVGHKLDPHRNYRLTLPSEVHNAIKEGWVLLETFSGPNEEPFVLTWRELPVSENN